jgi:hypothetical protein
MELPHRSVPSEDQKPSLSNSKNFADVMMPGNETSWWLYHPRFVTRATLACP